MASVNKYHKMVAEFAKLIKEATSYPLGQASTPYVPSIPKDAPIVLMFSPHPDDECLVGALPLRLLREKKYNVINVAVTQGSKRERQIERLEELKNACKYLGFGLLQTSERGLEKINLKTRESSPEHWNACVEKIKQIIEEYKPAVIFFPHSKDWNSTHIGTHYLVMDALEKLPKNFCCTLCETEYWAPMEDPNIMVESSVADVADLVTATSFHIGEVNRNPYHIKMPAWMIDNVRRGGELVGGQGCETPNFTFATLYRISKWANGKKENLQNGKKFISITEPPEIPV